MMLHTREDWIRYKIQLGDIALHTFHYLVGMEHIQSFDLPKLPARIETDITQSLTDPRVFFADHYLWEKETINDRTT